MSDTLNRALMKIEDDLILVETATGVLFLAFANLEEDGRGDYALAKSLHFAGMGIAAACASSALRSATRAILMPLPGRHASDWQDLRPHGGSDRRGR